MYFNISLSEAITQSSTMKVIQYNTNIFHFAGNIIIF